MTTTEPIQQTGRERVDLFGVVRDDELLSVSDAADIHIRLRESGPVVDTVTQAVAVKKGRHSYDIPDDDSFSANVPDSIVP